MSELNIEPSPRRVSSGVHHYYGDSVRQFFILGSLVTLLSLPVFLHIVTFSIWYLIAVALVLVFVRHFHHHPA